MYNSETPKSDVITEIYLEDQNPPPSSDVSMNCTLTHTHQSSKSPGKSGESIPTVYTQTVENITRLGSPYQPNPFGISNQLCNCTNPKCTHPHQSSIKQHQSPNLPQPFQLPPHKTTPLPLATGNSIPSHNTPNMPSNSHTTPPTTPNKMSSNPHTTPPTTPNNTPSNPHTTTTCPTPCAISTRKCQDFLHMTSNPYPTPYPKFWNNWPIHHEQRTTSTVIQHPYNSPTTSPHLQQFAVQHSYNCPTTPPHLQQFAIQHPYNCPTTPPTFNNLQSNTPTTLPQHPLTFNNLQSNTPTTLPQHPPPSKLASQPPPPPPSTPKATSPPKPSPPN